MGVALPMIVSSLKLYISAVQISTKKRGKGNFPDGKVHGANMGPIWGQQDPGGPHVGSMYFAIWVVN